MPVFISYRHTDRDRAMEINQLLKNAQIKTYLDVMDLESQTTDDITSVITRNVQASTHLIAVISRTTSQSWWVPFEIGEATICGCRISSFQTSYENLPQYLEHWPKMKHERDLAMFIEEYRQSTKKSRVMGMEDYSAESSSQRIDEARESAEHFHKRFKTRLARGW